MTFTGSRLNLSPTNIDTRMPSSDCCPRSRCSNSIPIQEMHISSESANSLQQSRHLLGQQYMKKIDGVIQTLLNFVFNGNQYACMNIGIGIVDLPSKAHGVFQITAIGIGRHCFCVVMATCLQSNALNCISTKTVDAQNVVPLGLLTRPATRNRALLLLVP